LKWQPSEWEENALPSECILAVGAPIFKEGKKKKKRLGSADVLNVIHK